jgi:cytochrome c peroxidase
MPVSRVVIGLSLTMIAACGAEQRATVTSPTATDSTTDAVAGGVMVLAPIGTQAAMVGVPFDFDASRNGTVFSDRRRLGLTYTVTFSPNANGLAATSARISGTPLVPGLQVVVVSARDAAGNTATQQFTLVVFGPDLTAPTLPIANFAYSDATAPVPRHFTGGGAGSVAGADNMPASNITTDAGATLGRVLFYDKRLSANDKQACASCHVQAFAFSDTARLSHGFAGGFTGRHSMGLSNARYYQPARFFWDERASSLEDQVLRPIQDATEMGLTLEQLLTKLSVTSYYPALFTAAFGTPEITSERVARALAQFVRSMVSGNSKFDRAFGPNGQPDFVGTFTAEELLGQTVYNGRGGCARCHGTNAHVSDQVHNTGLDATITDAGAGGGRFKAPSLRNVAVRAPYMHDGRFRTLDEVVDFYDRGVQNNPQLDPRLRGPNGQPLRLNLNPAERAGLIAFLNTFTDQGFLTNPKFASPFR